MSGSPSQCCSNPPTPSSSSGEGSLVEIGGLKAYASGSSDSKLAVVLISDLFGYEAPNLRYVCDTLNQLADKVAASGFYVVVPDFFFGDPYVAGNAERPISVWVKDHQPDKGFEDAKPVIAALRDNGVSAIGAAGFCWGAKVVLELAKCAHIQAGVLLHPALVAVDDFKGLKAPIAVLGAEHDRVSPPALVKQFEEVLAAESEVKWCVKIYLGAVHGWSVRYNIEDEEEVKRTEEVQKDMLDWFVEHVK